MHKMGAYGKQTPSLDAGARRCLSAFTGGCAPASSAFEVKRRCSRFEREPQETGRKDLNGAVGEDESPGLGRTAREGERARHKVSELREQRLNRVRLLMPRPPPPSLPC